MTKCKLCLTNEANQTGSHIFTYAWIKSAINQAGQNRRDKELTFSIDSFNLVGSYFGREVSREKIEEILQREMTDEEIEENENYFTIDNLVCQECEKRFTTSENYFNNKVHVPLKKGELTKQIDSRGNSLVELNETDFSIDLVRLNIFVQIWRASAANYEGFKLKPKFEEKIRKIVDSNLELDLDRTLENCANNKDEIRSIGLITTFVETETNTKDAEELTTNMIFLSKGKIPYFLILNDIYIQLYEKRIHLKSTIQHLLGLNNIIDKFEHNNINETKFRIGVLNNANRMKVIENLGKLLARQVLMKLISFFSRSYRSIFGIKPTKEILQEVINEVINNEEVSEELRYTRGNVIKVFVKVMHGSLRK